MPAKHGLGKGLSALIPESTSNDNKMNVNNISINLIKPNESQPRKFFDEEKIASLSDSIKQYGIIEPLVLKKYGEIYTIIAGERRFRAAKLAGITEVPVVIMDLSDKNVLELSLIENIQREDLNPIEEACAYTRLLNEFNLTQEELSEKIGKSRSAISNCLRLLNLDDRVKDYIIEGVISEGHGRALLSINNKDTQYEISQIIIDNDFNVRDTEKLIRNFDNKLVSVDNKKLDVFHEELQDKLEDYFGAKVTIQCKNDKGSIKIAFSSDEDLERILETLKI